VRTKVVRVQGATKVYTYIDNEAGKGIDQYSDGVIAHKPFFSFIAVFDLSLQNLWPIDFGHTLSKTE
jgi:hypothetical protein